MLTCIKHSNADEEDVSWRELNEMIQSQRRLCPMKNSGSLR